MYVWLAQCGTAVAGQLDGPVRVWTVLAHPALAAEREGMKSRTNLAKF